MSNLVKLDIEMPALTMMGHNQSAQLVTIEDQADYNFAAEMLTAVKSRWSAIEEERKKLKKPIDDAAKAVQGFFKPILDDLTAAEGTLKSKLLTYTRDQERKAAEAQREADAAAARERAALEARAAEELAAGNVEKATQLATVAEVTQAPTIVSNVQKAAGLSTKRVWKVEVTDVVAFLQLAAQREDLRAFITIDIAALSRLAAATDGKMPIPGCRIYQDEVMSARRAA